MTTRAPDATRLFDAGDLWFVVRFLAAVFHQLRRDLDIRKVTTPPNNAAMATACQGLRRT